LSIRELQEPGGFLQGRRMIPRDRLLLIGALIVGTALRFASLDSVPPSLNQDEAVNGYDAFSLAVTGRDHHGHPFPFAGLESFGDWASPLLTFLTAPSVGVFGLRPAAVRSVSSAIGVLLIPIVYRLGVELFDRTSLGLIAAWLIAVSPWHVHRSRFANPAAVVPTMVALLLLALVWTLRRQSSRGVIAVAIISVLTIASYPTMKLYVPLLLLAATLIYYRSIRRLSAESIICALAILVLFAGPIFYLSIFDPGGRARFDQISVFNRPVTASLLVRQYASYFSPRVFFISGNGHPGQTPTPPGAGVEPLSTLPLLLSGLLWLTAVAARSSSPGATRQSGIFVLSAVALYPVAATLTVQDVPHLGRAAQVIPLLAITCGAGAVALADAAARLRPDTWKRYVIAGAVMLGGGLTVELVQRFRDYFERYSKREAVIEYFQYGLPDAVAYVRAHEKDYDQIWMTNDNQTYIYLLFFGSWPPSDVHRNLVVRRDPPQFNEVDAIGKYRFGVPPNGMVNGLRLVYSISDPVGRTAYQISRGETANRDRILVVSKPH
jgi:4-amino-4-deoxy-L-arabinose transferase-like glycosyltransferase